AAAVVRATDVVVPRVVVLRDVDDGLAALVGREDVAPEEELWRAVAACLRLVVEVGRERGVRGRNGFLARCEEGVPDAGQRFEVGRDGLAAGVADGLAAL